MDKELIEQLLNPQNQEDFLKVVLSTNSEFTIHRKMWAEEVVDHFINLFNITREEFEKSFFRVTPIDDFDDEAADE